MTLISLQSTKTSLIRISRAFWGKSIHLHIVSYQSVANLVCVSNTRALRGHKRKASHDLNELADENASRAKRPTIILSLETDGPRRRYDDALVTDADLRDKALVSNSSIRPQRDNPKEVQSLVTPTSSPDRFKQALKTPLSHLDPNAEFSSALSDRPVPTALGRPKKIKTPKVKTPRKQGVDPQRRVVLAGRPELHDNNRHTVGSGPDSAAPSTAPSSADNSDYCAACGGEGYLLCCDGLSCKRSFHFACVSPPIQEIGEIGDSWYCDDCKAKHRRKESVSVVEDDLAPEDSFFGPLLNALVDKNPQAFALPEALRNHFPDVNTGANGEYMETHLTSSRSTNRRGGATGTTADAPYDYFRSHDLVTNKTILCHACVRPARHPDRPIVTCDHCPASWHFDCLDPPRTYHPHKYANENRHRQNWMCPLHIGHDLARIDELEQHRGSRVCKPTHRMRFPRDVTTVRSALTAGVKNNGNIEIFHDTDDETSVFDSDDEPAYTMAQRVRRRQDDNTVRYSLSNTEVALDFIHKVKTEHVQEQQREYLDMVRNVNAAARIARKSEYQDLKNLRQLEGKMTERDVGEQQAALKLVQMAVGSYEGMGEGVGELVRTLVAEAPKVVTARSQPRPVVNGVLPDGDTRMDEDGTQQQAKDITDGQAAELLSLKSKIDSLLAQHRASKRSRNAKAPARS